MEPEIADNLDELQQDHDEILIQIKANSDKMDIILAHLGLSIDESE